MNFWETSVVDFSNTVKSCPMAPITGAMSLPPTASGSSNGEGSSVLGFSMSWGIARPFEIGFAVFEGHRVDFHRNHLALLAHHFARDRCP